MTAPTIRLAHSRNKHGFRVFSYERYDAVRGGHTRAGFHVVSAETLEDAVRELLDRIRYDWRSIGRAVPEIVDCGRLADATCRTYRY